MKPALKRYESNHQLSRYGIEDPLTNADKITARFQKLPKEQKGGTLHDIEVEHETI